MFASQGEETAFLSPVSGYSCMKDFISEVSTVRGARFIGVLVVVKIAKAPSFKVNRDGNGISYNFRFAFQIRVLFLES
ncbi:hypothetical protein LR48_Vigan05g015300 [Vigna angularis]|uniref:Uncharacterized protein n=1 Tax=Phaseolus angularis TaxID=3914 RepID=A0A0L9UJ21_PHAAN|nr:hypothetical protein LR48_Vigan05g015300 [Vigna angularis]